MVFKMNSKKIKFSLIFLSVFVTIFFAGCSNQGIQFNRESAFDKFKSTFGQEEKKNTKKIYRSKGGVIIFKDETTHNTTNSNIRFGPSEIKFDMPLKFK